MRPPEFGEWQAASTVELLEWLARRDADWRRRVDSWPGVAPAERARLAENPYGEALRIIQAMSVEIAARRAAE